MKRDFFVIVLLLSAVFVLSSCGSNKNANTSKVKETNFYAFEVTDIDGQSYPMGDLKGKKVMIVNVASKCGFTPQYEPLQKLYEMYRNRDFVIIGFPANNFMSQEPGTDLEIKEFCSSKYSVTFPMMSKISVKGDDQHPLYSWLTQKSLNGMADSEVKWNFQKYLISGDGKLVGMAGTREEPDSKRIIRWIEEDVQPGF